MAASHAHRAPSVAVSNVPPNTPSRRPRPARVWPRLALAVACACALVAPITAGADPDGQAIVAAGLLDAAQAQPDADFQVIVQGPMGSSAVAAEVEAVASEEAVEHQFRTVSAVAADLTGSELVELAGGADPILITLDSAVAVADDLANQAASPAGDEPTVVGDLEPGVELEVTAGALAESASLAYRWQRCGDDYEGTCSDIAGAVEETYTPTPDDEGFRLRVVVTGGPSAETAASAITEPVTAKPPVAVSPPSILGTGEEGQTLRAANGSWSGTMLFGYSYQWQRCDASGDACAGVDGATDTSYTLTSGDVGATIRLLVAVEGLGGTG